MGFLPVHKAERGLEKLTFSSGKVESPRRERSERWGMGGALAGRESDCFSLDEAARGGNPWAPTEHNLQMQLP